MKSALKKTSLIYLYLIYSCAAYAINNTDEQIHQLALSQAKAGFYEKSIIQIRSLANKHPKPNRYFYDYIAILGWSSEHQQIVNESANISINKAPQYVLNALAIALRNQKNFEAAKTTYKTIIRRFNNNIDASIGLSLILIDQKEYALAEKNLNSLAARHQKNLNLLYAYAYLHEAKNQLVQALAVYEKILLIKPNDKNTYKNKVISINKLGASHLAFSLIDDTSLFTPSELARIKADMAAHRIRWGQVPVLRPSQRFNETDVAITEITQNINNSSKQLGENSTITLNSQFDLLVALRNRFKMEQVIKQYKQLIAQKKDVPNYSKNAYCDALLYLEQPAQAETCYLEIIQAGHQNINTKIALFYAYLENEKFNTAQAWIRKIASEQPINIKGIGKKKVLKGNPKKTQTESVRALSIAFADDLGHANNLFSTLHNNAAFNTSLRKELANVYYWRGWPRKAQEEYDIGLHQEPKNIGLRLGQARNWLALKEFQQAELAIATLAAAFPEDKGIEKQKRLWDIHQMREFRTDISSSKSDGGTNGSRGLSIDSYLYSKPFDYNYRAFLHQRHAQAEFIEGDGLLNHAGIGIEYSAPNKQFTGELHHNRFDNNRIGVSITGQYSFDDYLSSNFVLESLSKDTPLRALNQGIYAKSLTLGTQYRWHESRSTGLNLSYAKFTDGNKRKSISGFWNERWYNQHNYKFSTRVDLFSSNNSRDNAIYFNPEQDFSGSIAFENGFLTWRRYEDSFHQRLILSTGFYNQKNFSNGSTWGLQYEHRWKANHRFEFIYGIQRKNNLYDGNHELSWDYYLTLDWRF